MTITTDYQRCAVCKRIWHTEQYCSPLTYIGPNEIGRWLGACPMVLSDPAHAVRGTIWEPVSEIELAAWIEAKKQRVFGTRGSHP